MDRIDKKLVNYMKGRHFAIPVYQRNYDWGIEQCDRLFDDLVEIVQNSREKHFFGCIVSTYHYHPNVGGVEFHIIDGQQRITTVMLLFLAMYNLIKEGAIKSQEKELNEIYDNYLVDEDEFQGTHLRLELVKADQEAYKRLFSEDTSNYIEGSNLTINYYYLRTKILGEEITIDDLYKAICKLTIIDFTLDPNDPDDNPQLIFECLNSTGLDLSEGDKIRNYIFMGIQDEQQQNTYYKEYWNKIENCTEYNVSAFIRDYLSVKLGTIPSQRGIYTSFVNYTKANVVGIETLLQDLYAYAKRYEILLKGGSGGENLDECVKRLNRLETTVTRPFFLEVFRLKEEGDLTITDVTNIFIITETYLFRRTMCDLPTNSLNKIFLGLHREIMRYDGTSNNYVEKFKYALLSKTEHQRFPKDQEFQKAFSEKQVFKMARKNKIYILDRLENYGTREGHEVYDSYDKKELSIEHIMPQQLTPEWKEELGDDYQNIYDTWIHRIANLTLTAYNSEYSNKSFHEKKTCKNGFDDSGIIMNRFISKKNKWTLEELEDRNEYLKKRALEIWPEPVTDYKPEEKEIVYTLEANIDFTNRRIVKFEFRDIDYTVSKWVDMFTTVIRILFRQDETNIIKLAISEDDPLGVNFTIKPDNLQKWEEIDDGIYVWTNSDTKSKISVLKRLFNLYDESPADLVFYLVEMDNTEDNVPDGGNELNLKYWTYALPVIKGCNEDNGSFSKVNPSKGNWVNGFFGVGGCYISCVTNQHGVRVELCMNKEKTSENKKLFDIIKFHKAEIEREISVPLVWDRGEEKKLSKIYYEIENVSIKNEKDWPQMASFQAEWSKKFIDVLVPYINNSILI